MAGINDDDPHDDVTHWVGQIPEAYHDSTECTAERTTRGRQQPNVQRKEPPLEEER